MIYRPVPLSIVLLVLFLAFSPALVFSQSECGDKLRQAQREFDTGHPQEALVLINDCISQEKFTRNEAIEAYRLITIIYLMENDPKADDYFRKLLKLNPEFRVDETLKVDPGELVFLYENFHTDPRFHLRIHAGANFSRVQELAYYDISPYPDDTKSYKNVTGFQVGFQVGIPLFTRNIRLNTGADFSQISYSLENVFDAFGDPEYTGIDHVDFGDPDVFEINLSEIQQIVQIPLLLSIDLDKWSEYNFKRNKVVPFFYAGASYHLLIRSSFPEVSTASRIGNFLSSSNFNDGEITDLRHKSNISLIAGAGVKLKILKNYFLFDFRYTNWLQNVVDAEYRYDNAELVHGFGHIDSDFTFRNFSMSVGFEVPIYVPRPRKNYKKK